MNTFTARILAKFEEQMSRLQARAVPRALLLHHVQSLCDTLRVQADLPCSVEGAPRKARVYAKGVSKDTVLNVLRTRFKYSEYSDNLIAPNTTAGVLVLQGRVAPLLVEASMGGTDISVIGSTLPDYGQILKKMPLSRTRGLPQLRAHNGFTSVTGWREDRDPNLLPLKQFGFELAYEEPRRFTSIWVSSKHHLVLEAATQTPGYGDFTIWDIDDYRKIP